MKFTLSRVPTKFNFPIHYLEHLLFYIFVVNELVDTIYTMCETFANTGRMLRNYIKSKF